MPPFTGTMMHLSPATSSCTVTPTPLLLTCYNSSYIIYSNDPVFLSSCTPSSPFLFVFLSLFPLTLCPHLIPSFSPPRKPQRITLNSKLLRPLHPSTHNFSFSISIPPPSSSSSSSSSSCPQPLSHNFTQHCCPICRHIHLSNSWSPESPSSRESGFFCSWSAKGVIGEAERVGSQMFIEASVLVY